MPEFKNPGDEWIDRALEGSELPGSSEMLRATVLAQTVGLIRRRRRMKKGVLGLALVGVYLAGIATSGLWRTSESVPPQSRAEQVAEVGAGMMVDGQLARSQTVRRQTGVAERRFVSAQVGRVRAIQNSGDRMLIEYGDVESAVRAYKQVLDRTPTRRQAVGVGQDTWLLMALKNAKSKEGYHERLQN